MRVDKDDIEISDYIDYYEKLTEFHNIDTDVFKLKIVEYFGKIDYYKFSWDELLKIGFATWDDNLILIPKYQYPCIIEGTILKNINGDEIIFEEGVTDDDDRFGYLSFGLSKEKLFGGLKNEIL
jgi:hypothetical protein